MLEKDRFGHLFRSESRITPKLVASDLIKGVHFSFCFIFAVLYLFDFRNYCNYCARM